MLYRPIHSNKKEDITRIDESNFISSDILGIFDSDARVKLSALTIEKLFEGLDIDNTNEMHDFITSFAPSLSKVMGVHSSESNYAFDILKAQLMYMQTILQDVENDIDYFYKNVINVHKSYTDGQTIETLVAKYSNPNKVGSIFPEVERIVQQAKKSGIDFNSPRVKETFKALQKLNVNTYISQTLSSIEVSASNISLLPLYKKIDAMELEMITGDNAIAPQNKSHLFLTLDFNSMYASLDPIARLGTFFEETLLQYPFGRQLKKNFGEEYEYFDTIEHSMSAIKQFVPSIEYSVFEPMKETLYEISALLVNRVFSMHPEEDSKNIFVPSFQVMWVSILSLLALRLINFNVRVSNVITQKKEDKKEAKVEETSELTQAYETLKQQNFFTDKITYKEGDGTMNPEIIKNINNILVKLTILPDSKINSTQYDSQTTEAIRTLQMNHSAEFVDGKIGQETKEIMEKIINHIQNKYKMS